MPILHDVSFAEYLRLPGAHFSALVHMEKSPLHYRRARDHERADTDALRLGRLTHALILTPELPPEVAVFRGRSRRGKAWEEFRSEAEGSGKLIVREDELDAARRMRDAVHAFPPARALLQDGRGEMTVTWTEEVPLSDVDGMTSRASYVPCRARLDWLGAAGIVEFKTTRWPGTRSWAREVASRWYHVQLAHYSAGVEAVADGLGMLESVRKALEVWWIVVENVPPHDVAVYRVSREDLDVGERKRLEWLRRVAECEASGRWPGVGGDAAIDFKLPDYAAVDGLDDVDLSGIEEASDGVE